MNDLRQVNGNMKGDATDDIESMSLVPDSNAAYNDVAYWETRFHNEQHHEWFAPFSRFKHLVTPHLSHHARILIIGNGTSRLPWDLHGDGYRHVTATDICPAVIDRAPASPGVVFEVANMLSLPYPDASFDAVIEKGTLDVLFTDSRSPWTPSETALDRMRTACKEIYRVLTPDGTFFSITFTQPLFRSPHYHCTHLPPSIPTGDIPGNAWSVAVEKFGQAGSLEYYVYRMVKGEQETQEITSPDPSKWESLEDPMHDYMDSVSFLSYIEID